MSFGLYHTRHNRVPLFQRLLGYQTLKTLIQLPVLYRELGYNFPRQRQYYSICIVSKGGKQKILYMLCFKAGKEKDSRTCNACRRKTAMVSQKSHLDECPPTPCFSQTVSPKPSAREKASSKICPGGSGEWLPVCLQRQQKVRLAVLHSCKNEVRLPAEKQARELKTCSTYYLLQ